MMLRFLPYILCLACVGGAFAGNSPKFIMAVRTPVPVQIDGVLDEQAWISAGAVLDFTQLDPQEGAPATELTSVRILYDDRALYVGVICYDAEPEKIVRQLTRRDRSSEADRFTIQIDSFRDRQTAFVFSTNVSGVQSDGVLSQDGIVYDITWDAVWDVKTRVYRDGWSSEFEIPYNALRFSRSPDEAYEWGINFRRYISRKHETDEWVMIPRSERLLISRWGHVKGIHAITPPLNLSVTPHVVSTSTYETATATRARFSDHSLGAGVDVKYGLTRDFTLDVTLDPDFGQVEVDKAVLNLTVFETNYPEKRPFFIEGAQLFAFGTSGVDNSSLPMFFSRRIGKRPSGSYQAPPGTTFDGNPLATTILGAVKLSGHAQSGLSLASMSALTDEETATIVDAAGSRATIRTEPRGSYTALRAKQEFGGSSWVGGIATLASRAAALPGMSGGIDWNLRFEDGTYTLDGYIAAARASVDQADRNGIAGRLLFARIAAEHWFYTASYNIFSRHFNSNDLGFFARPHDHGGFLELRYQENFASEPLRRYYVKFLPQARWNWDGILTEAGLGSQCQIEFTNFWRLTLSHIYDVPAYDDAERGIIGIYRRPANHQIVVDILTDERGPVAGSATLLAQVDAKRKSSVGCLLGITFRPVSWIELNPSMYYARTRSEEAWLVQNGNVLDTAVSPSPFSVFGDRDVDQVDISLRGILTFTRALSLQFYSQVLLARGKYENYRRLTNSTLLIPYAYGSLPGFVSGDFNAATFNANLLVRWEFLPASTLYFVWTQGRMGDSGTYGTGFARRFADTFRLPHEDVVVLKLSYWLPF